MPSLSVANTAKKDRFCAIHHAAFYFFSNDLDCVAEREGFESFRYGFA